MLGASGRNDIIEHDSRLTSVRFITECKKSGTYLTTAASMQSRRKVLNAFLITKTQKARFVGVQSEHAGAWLHAMPISNCGLHLDDETTRIAVGIRLGAAICHPHTCPCGGLVDALGHHCFVCRKSIGKQTRHSLFNDVIWRFFARAKIQASKSPLESSMITSVGRCHLGSEASVWHGM